MPSNVPSSKGRIRTLLLEGVNDSAVELFVNSNFTNIERLPKALDADGLLQAIKDVDLLGIRSRTQLTHEALAGADRLVAVGCFSVGTNQVDLAAARQRGIPVFNAPFSNTRSVAELVIGEIVMLLRRIFPRSAGRSQGWLGQIGDRQPRGARPNAWNCRLWQYRIAALDPGRRHGHEGHLLRSHRQASPRQYRACRKPSESAGSKRHCQPSCSGNAGHAWHDRRSRTSLDEARGLPDQ